jgi:hypothetical protein
MIDDSRIVTLTVSNSEACLSVSLMDSCHTGKGRGYDSISRSDVYVTYYEDGMQQLFKYV